MNANVKRAVGAALDVLYAEARNDAEGASERGHLKKVALASLDASEFVDYQVEITHAWNSAQTLVGDRSLG